MTRPWRPRSVRLQLTLWYVGAVAIVLGLYAAGVLVFLRSTLQQSLDQLLHDDFELTEGLLVRGMSGIELIRRPHHEPEAASRRAIEVWDGGELRLGFPDNAAAVADVARPPIQMSGYEYASMVLGDGTHVRTLTGPVHQLSRHPLVMRVSRSEEPMRHELRDLALVLGLAWPVALGMAGAGGYLLARRALAPVDQMAERARSITADRLDQRLPVENPGDELGRLATVFNDTLARLEDAFARLTRFTADWEKQGFDQIPVRLMLKPRWPDR